MVEIPWDCQILYNVKWCKKVPSLVKLKKTVIMEMLYIFVIPDVTCKIRQ